MKKGLKKMHKKLVYVGVSMALALTVLVGGFATTAKKAEAGSNGTERDWKVTLPHGNGNFYFPFRKKETNMDRGYVEVRKMGSSGVNVWFNTGTNVNDAKKITGVKMIDKSLLKFSVYVDYFEGKYSKGMSVDLGIENNDNTWLQRDDASGTVNYR